MADGRPTQAERLTALEGAITLVIETTKAMSSRQDKQDALIENVGKIASSTERLAIEQQHMKTDMGKIETNMDKIDKKVDCLMGASGKKWDAVSLSIITIIVGTIIGILSSKLF